MKICVVIPVYKRYLDKTEKISLNQALKVLEKYDLYFIMPKSLETTSFIADCGGIKAERFEDYYFNSINSYNELCMSPEFYSRFSAYDYLLIYQLDAFVFYDELSLFADKGYDFIGAPVPPSCWYLLNNYVGNGGLSLRKVESFLRILSQQIEVRSTIIETYGGEISGQFFDAEDKFYSFCAQRREYKFNTPSVSEAFGFSIEFNIDGIFNGIESHLPFGCHRWPFYKFSIWKRLIEKYGYDLSDVERLISRNDEDSFNQKVIEHWLLKGNNSALTHRLLEHVKWDDILIWGAGKLGNRCKTILQSAGFDSFVFWDENISDSFKRIMFPSDDELKRRKNPVIIAMKDKSDIEFVKTRVSKGSDCGFIVWNELLLLLAEEIGVSQYGDTMNSI